MTMKLKVIIEKYEAELGRWRKGEEVPEEERAVPKLKNVQLAVVGGEETLSTSLLDATPTSAFTTPIATPTPVQARAFEEERSRLCQQLDEKVCGCGCGCVWVSYLLLPPSLPPHP